MCKLDYNGVQSIGLNINERWSVKWKTYKEEEVFASLSCMFHVYIFLLSACTSHRSTFLKFYFSPLPVNHPTYLKGSPGVYFCSSFLFLINEFYISRKKSFYILKPEAELMYCVYK